MPSATLAEILVWLSMNHGPAAVNPFNLRG